MSEDSINLISWNHTANAPQKNIWQEAISSTLSLLAIRKNSVNYIVDAEFMHLYQRGRLAVDQV